MPIDNIPRTIWWEDGKVMLIDQTRLPLVRRRAGVQQPQARVHRDQTLAVRGAPALGVAAALGMALWVIEDSWDIYDDREFLRALDLVAHEITSTRPTAVNLLGSRAHPPARAMRQQELPLDELRDLILQEALAMQAEDEERNRAIGANGAELLSEGPMVLTHCNAGSLATAYFGTALGVIFTAHEQGKIERRLGR
jgi:methylthioribose-1-phosphate isomerase